MFAEAARIYIEHNQKIEKDIGGIIMILKSIDLGLMAEHLTAHKGIISKLRLYYCSVGNPTLKQIIYEQFLIMRNHVRVMLMLMDPARNETVSISALTEIQPVEIKCKPFSSYMSDKSIALEAHNTAKSMALDNFSSALRMKTSNVRDIHIQMALQQVKLQEKYTEFIHKMGDDHAPSASFEEQKNTMAEFLRMFHMQSRK